MINGKLWLHRKIVKSKIWKGPANRLKLFLWLLMKANFKDLGEIKRGQACTTMKDIEDALTEYYGYRKVAPSVRTINKYLK